MPTHLENPVDSPCWGCGPLHPRGLHLSFEREGDAVRTSYVPKTDEVGWPGLFHTGLHFAVLFETCYWAALELTGRVHIASGTHQFHQARLPRVGRPFVSVARIVGAEGSTMIRVRAETTNADGKLCGWLEAGMQKASRAAIERAGVVLPQYLLDQMDP
ncbi:MAG: PaaI family thioesterase [Thermoplasmatota archaeon]